jgi:hypothetical protein
MIKNCEGFIDKSFIICNLGNIKIKILKTGGIYGYNKSLDRGRLYCLRFM